MITDHFFIITCFSIRSLPLVDFECGNACFHNFTSSNTHLWGVKIHPRLHTIINQRFNFSLYLCYVLFLASKHPPSISKESFPSPQSWSRGWGKMGESGEPGKADLVTKATEMYHFSEAMCLCLPRGLPWAVSRPRSPRPSLGAKPRRSWD